MSSSGNETAGGETARPLDLARLAKRSRERLRRFPSWLTTGSQKEFDEWLLGITEQIALSPLEVKLIGRVRAAEAAYVETMTALQEIWLDHDRLKRIEALAEARLIALQQYAGHHSPCVDCYRVWERVESALSPAEEE